MAVSLSRYSLGADRVETMNNIDSVDCPVQIKWTQWTEVYSVESNDSFRWKRLVPGSNPGGFTI